MIKKIFRQMLGFFRLKSNYSKIHNRICEALATLIDWRHQKLENFVKIQMKKKIDVNVVSTQWI